MNYVTDEHFKTANLNGIDKANVYNRVYACGWDVERAITVPVKRKDDSLWLKYKDKVNQTGITKMGFYQRIYKGMTPEEASTIPKIPKKGRRRANAKITKELIDKASSNGISEKTLKNRVYIYKWDKERAATEPVHQEKRKKGSMWGK